MKNKGSTRESIFHYNFVSVNIVTGYIWATGSKQFNAPTPSVAKLLTSLPYLHVIPQPGLHPLQFSIMGVRGGYRVSLHMPPYHTIRLPSDSLSRWRWDRASEARTPADTECTEASPDLLPDGGALMWAQISLVSPAWLGLSSCQDVGTFRALGSRFWWTTTSPRWCLTPGYCVIIGHKLTRVSTVIILWKKRVEWWFIQCIHNYSGTHRQTHNRSLDISLDNINITTLTALRPRGKKKEFCDKTKKAWRNKWVRLVEENFWALRSRKRREEEERERNSGAGRWNSIHLLFLLCKPAWTLCMFMNVVSFSPLGF